MDIVSSIIAGMVGTLFMTVFVNTERRLQAITSTFLLFWDP